VAKPDDISEDHIAPMARQKQAKPRRSRRRPNRVKQQNGVNSGNIKHSGANDCLELPAMAYPSSGDNESEIVSVASQNNSSSVDSDDSESVRRQHYSWWGNLPDVEWRAIPQDHLRRHPLFRPLPATPPSTPLTADNLEFAIRQFRQGSFQWDILHEGRCTTSQTAAALGFLEDVAGEILKIPKAWRRGGKGAYERLRQPALRTMEEMNRVLVPITDSSSGMGESNDALTQVWMVPPLDRTAVDSGPAPKFVAKYLASATSVRELERRKQRIRKQLYPHSSDKKKRSDMPDSRVQCRSLRMQWGNTQEATAVLTALNYFARDNPPGTLISEVGMCGAGLPLNRTAAADQADMAWVQNDSDKGQSGAVASSLLVGATPDALLHYADGRIEVIEVKNHCPFHATSFQSRKGSAKKKNKNGKNKRFYVREMDFDESTKNGTVCVPIQYVPQLQMEMLCVGEECRSAVMVRQTATKGALIVRMHRCDSWINEMLYWLHRFQENYVNRQVPPPRDFFLLHGDSVEGAKRYRRFLNQTLEIQRESVEVVARIDHRDIQRTVEAPFFLD
jgi:hypothetical protein